MTNENGTAAFAHEDGVLSNGASSKPQQDLASDWKKEGDRALVLLVAAELDHCLKLAIEGMLLPPGEREDRLLDPEGPLGTFGSRIELSHRLGLIDPDYVRALNLVRELRHSFAQEPMAARLDSGTHRDNVRQLVLLLKNKFPEDSSFQRLWTHPSPRSDFEYIALKLIAQLTWVIGKAARVRPIWS